MRRWVWHVAAVLIWSTVATAYDAVEVPSPATLQGVVRVGEDLEIDREKDSFASKELFGFPRAMTRELQVGASSGLANAIVVVLDVDAGHPAEPRELELVNEDLEFSPRVQVATIGSRLTVTNKDDVLHNVHAFQRRRHLFNFALPTTDVVLHYTFKKKGLVSFHCDISHEWMTAFIYVSDHPYVAVTDEEGRFRIEGLPAGSYQVAVWHEWLGEIGEAVVLRSGKTTEQELVFRSDNRRSQPTPWLVGK